MKEKRKTIVFVILGSICLSGCMSKTETKAPAEAVETASPVAARTKGIEEKAEKQPAYTVERWYHKGLDGNAQDEKEDRKANMEAAFSVEDSPYSLYAKACEVQSEHFKEKVFEMYSRDDDVMLWNWKGEDTAELKEMANEMYEFAKTISEDCLIDSIHRERNIIYIESTAGEKLFVYDPNTFFIAIQ